MQRIIKSDRELDEAMVTNYQAAKQTVEEFFGPSNVRDYEGHVSAENETFSVMLVRPRGGTTPGSHVPVLLILHGSPEQVKKLKKIMDDKNIVCSFESINDTEAQNP